MTITLERPVSAITQDTRPLDAPHFDHPSSLLPKSILFPTDGSALSLKFLPQVREAAEKLQATVTVLNLSHGSPEGVKPVMDSLREVLTPEKVRLANGSGLIGDAGSIISAMAVNNPGLIMLPAKSRGIFPRWSTSLQHHVARESDCPLWFDLDPSPKWEGIKRIVVALALSHRDRFLLRRAAQLAKLWDVPLHILHAIPRPGISSLHLAAVRGLPPTYSHNLAAQRIASLQQEVGTNADVRIVVGGVARTVATCRDCQDGSLLVIGSQRASTNNLGPVTSAVLQAAPGPALIL